MNPARYVVGGRPFTVEGGPFPRFAAAFHPHLLDFQWLPETRPEPGFAVGFNPAPLGSLGLAGRTPLVDRRTPTHHITIYRDSPGGYAYIIANWHKEPIAAFRCNEDFSRAELAYIGPDVEPAFAFNMLGQIYVNFVLCSGGYVLHSAVLRYKNAAVLFCAPSGTGKTTHANLWEQAGLGDVVNSDLGLCVRENGAWRLRGLPWGGSGGVAKNVDLPLLAVVDLHRAPHNRAVRLPIPDAIAALMDNALFPWWEPRLTDLALEAVGSIVNDVPVLRLECLPDMGAVVAARAEVDRATQANPDRLL